MVKTKENFNFEYFFKLLFYKNAATRGWMGMTERLEFFHITSQQVEIEMLIFDTFKITCDVTQYNV